MKAGKQDPYYVLAESVHCTDKNTHAMHHLMRSNNDTLLQLPKSIIEFDEFRRHF